ncbi:universal stress protein [Billgrantia kenyensis]|uniref:Universal stress protein n=1 Tax=Billgrantia kenyensis TaxID=321266 RepID=A0A7V9W4L2_9GAMM|nr:universal stress protein [Halomonas kenyensis]MBA2780899.1 universal stress protein [Halomonas kenyensis]MCG6663640.1 universal stress protein [Halomonas kenyensis]
MHHTILVPLDGSSHAVKALTIAAQLARASSAALYLLHVTELPDDIGILAGSTGQPFTEERRQELARQSEQQAREAIDNAREAVDLSGLEVKELIREGRPADTILSQAADIGVDAIVMGSRGVSELKGMLMGSVSHKVTHAAACTVITVT